MSQVYFLWRDSASLELVTPGNATEVMLVTMHITY